MSTTHKVNAKQANKQAEAELHNIKSIFRMNGYLNRLFYSYLSVYKTLVIVQNDILKLQNDLNFKSPDAQLIESYNKTLTFMSDQIEGVLAEKVSDTKCSETFVIKPVNVDKNQYVHKLEITYFLTDLICITKPIGEVSNVSVIKVNDHIKILRAKTDPYDFVLIDSSVKITTEYFRDHLDKYFVLIKELLQWFYNDIDYTKLAFRALIDIMANATKLSENCSEKKKWIILYEKVKSNTDEIFKSLLELDNI